MLVLVGFGYFRNRWDTIYFLQNQSTVEIPHVNSFLVKVLVYMLYSGVPLAELSSEVSQSHKFISDLSTCKTAPDDFAPL